MAKHFISGKLTRDIHYHWVSDTWMMLMVVGMPRLMMSFTEEGQVDVNLSRELQAKVDGISLDKRKEWRKDIPEPKIHPSNAL